MLALLWNLSVTLHGYLRCYAPTNRVINWLRTQRGLKWAIPVALVTTPTYLGLMALAIQGATRPGLGWLNLLALLYSWNAMKFDAMAVFSPLFMLRSVIARRPGRTC